VEEHLRGCLDCRRRCDEFRETWRLLDEADLRTTPRVASDFAEKVLARALAEEQRGPLGRFSRLPAVRLTLTGAAAAAAAVLFLVGVYSTTRPARADRSLQPAEQQCVLYLDLLKDLSAVEHMEMVRSVQTVGKDSDLQEAIRNAEPEDWGAELPTEDAGV